MPCVEHEHNSCQLSRRRRRPSTVVQRISAADAVVKTAAGVYLNAALDGIGLRLLLQVQAAHTERADCAFRLVANAFPAFDHHCQTLTVAAPSQRGNQQISLPIQLLGGLSLRGGSTVSTTLHAACGTKEMVQPCLIYLHAISLQPHQRLVHRQYYTACVLNQHSLPTQRAVAY